MLTGGTGFLGSAILREFRAHGVPIFTLPGKSRNYPDYGSPLTLDMIRGRHVDLSSVNTLIHVGTFFTKESDSIARRETNESNYEWPRQLVEALEDAAPLESVLNFNSTWQIPELSPRRNLSSLPYSQSKRLFGQFLTERYSHRIKIHDLYIQDSFGPFDSRPKLIPYLVQCGEKNTEPQIQDPTAQLNLVHSSHLARLIFTWIRNEIELPAKFAVVDHADVSVANIWSEISEYFLGETHSRFLQHKTTSREAPKLSQVLPILSGSGPEHSLEHELLELCTRKFLERGHWE